jgi:hypothetical protein
MQHGHCQQHNTTGNKRHVYAHRDMKTSKCLTASVRISKTEISLPAELAYRTQSPHPSGLSIFTVDHLPALAFPPSPFKDLCVP